MPAQVSQSPLAGLFDPETQKAVSARAQDPISIGGGDMPPGVMDGRAKLVSIKFGLRDKESKKKLPDGTSAAGKPYCMLTAAAVSPEHVVFQDGNTSQVAGKFTRIDISLHPDKIMGQPKTKDEMILHLMNHMKAIVDNQKLFAGFPVITGEALQQVADGLVKESVGPSKSGLFIKFGTRSGKPTPAYPNPMTFHEWYGSAGSDYRPPSLNGRLGVQDDNKPAPTSPQQPTTPPTQAAQAQPTDPLFGKPQTSSPTTAPQPDVAALVKQAESGLKNDATKAAQEALVARAVANGATHQQCEDAADFAAVAKLGDPKPAEASPVDPVKGDLWKFTKAPMIDPDSGEVVAGQFRTVDVTVMEVLADGYDCLNFKNQKTKYKAQRADLVPA